MPLIIRNIAPLTDGWCQYSIRINDQPVLANFRHLPNNGVAECLRAAARAIEEQQPSPNRNSDFIAGVKWAINQLQSEAHDLSDVRDGYIEAKTTGVHGGRKIDPNFAAASARQFHERSDAVHLAAEDLEKQIKPK